MSAYKDFVTRLRGHYPQASMVCAVGPMLSDAYPPGQDQWSTLQGWVSSLVKDFNDRGDTRVHYLAFERQTEPYGEDWHPSATTHAAMATRLRSSSAPAEVSRRIQPYARIRCIAWLLSGRASGACVEYKIVFVDAPSGQ